MRLLPSYPCPVMGPARHAPLAPPGCQYLPLSHMLCTVQAGAGRGLQRLVKCQRPRWPLGLIRRLSSSRTCSAESGTNPFHPDHSRRCGAVCAHALPRGFSILLIRPPLRDTCTLGAPAPTHSLAYRLITGERGDMVDCSVSASVWFCVCTGAQPGCRELKLLGGCMSVRAAAA